MLLRSRASAGEASFTTRLSRSSKRRASSISCVLSKCSSTSRTTLSHCPSWARYLRTGGSIVVSVPQGHGRFSEGDARLGHFRRYDPPELEEKLRAAGFADVVTVMYGSPWGNVQEAIRRIAFRLRPSEKSLSERTAESARFLQPPAWGVQATRAISMPFRYLQRPLARRGVGTGVVAVGRLPDGSTSP